MTKKATGGTARTVAAGIEQIKSMLPDANRVQCKPVDASHLVIGLQCGCSDRYSGISANLALGAAVDRLVALGGTAILSETPEIYGAEHLLTRRVRIARDRPQAGRPHPLVGSPLRANECQPRQQPLSGQQGGRPLHHTGEIARCRGKGRDHQSGRRVPLCGADGGAWAGLHGHPGYEPVSATGQVARWPRPGSASLPGVALDSPAHCKHR